MVASRALTCPVFRRLLTEVRDRKFLASSGVIVMICQVSFFSSPSGFVVTAIIF
ncbi:hypothetical protein FSY75_19265 [Streptomyces sp. TR1341]|nr:hypothetical protein [Streptomyces sp. TR1341]